jgi:hypothetical protein
MTKREQLLLFVPDDSLLFADGFDDAILGLDTLSLRVVYSKQQMIQILIDEDMTPEDAIEFLEYNTWNTYVGEQTPIFVDQIDVFE